MMYGLYRGKQRVNDCRKTVYEYTRVCVYRVCIIYVYFVCECLKLRCATQYASVCVSKVLTFQIFRITDYILNKPLAAF